MRSVADIAVSGARVLVRCDFNVPLDASGSIRDDFRVRRTLPTLEHLRSQGAKVICMSHLGKREDGLSLKPVALRLQELLGSEVRFSPDCIGQEAEELAARLPAGGLLLAENLRLHQGEEENDPEFARALARMGELYVNDAFAASHRNHASLVELPRILPASAGFLLQEEVETLSQLRKNPKRPLVLIVGGAKVVTKARFLVSMLGKADAALVGNLLAQAAEEGRVSFPADPSLVYPPDGRPSREIALDIGPATVDLFKQRIQEAGTVLWAGPLGKIEEEEYAKGSLAIARAVLESPAFSVVGGGNLGDFLGDCGLREKFSYASTGGSAMLAFVAGEEMPGIAALEENNQ